MSSWGTALGSWPVWRSVTPARPEVLLVLVSAAVYLVSRLWAIDSFPIYFYSDEVNYVLFGEQAIERGLVGIDGSWPAVYVEWDTNRWGPAAGMYLQGLAALAFGKRIWIARGIEALTSLGGVLAVAWILKEHFRNRFWWASIPLAASVPVWFLYTRTAFSVATATSLYAVFLLAYLHYRFRSPASLGLAALAGAAAFYSYNNMMFVMAALAACLLIADVRYHLQHRRVWLRTLPVLVLLAVPFIEYSFLHPESIRANLSALGSYWVEDIPLTAKLLRYAQNYVQGLNPFYWFGPQRGTGILPVQFIPGAGHLGFTLLPLVALGLYVVVRNRRSVQHRILVLSALVVPASSALDSIEVYRVLAMVVPALILGVLGLEQLGEWLKSISPRRQTAIAAVGLFVLALARFIGGVVFGPTWPTDYGLSGAQFGAKALYVDTIPALLAENPSTTLVMNTTWANNSHLYPLFFLSPPERERVRFGNVRDYLNDVLPLDPGTIFAMTPDEYADAVASPMLGEVQVVRSVPRPNGDPGFYLAHIAYASDVERVMQEQLALHNALVEDQVRIMGILGQPATIFHSKLGDGQIANLFDGSADTLVRGDRVNPLKIEVRFPEIVALQGVRVTVGSIQDFSIILQVTPAGSDVPLTVSGRFKDQGPDPTVELDLPGPPVSASAVRLEITDNTHGSEAMIHVREIAFR
jgi:4-amino-4-deoxy-L-arabinose transferase-like glycosyltransferase